MRAVAVDITDWRFREDLSIYEASCWTCHRVTGGLCTL